MKRVIYELNKQGIKPRLRARRKAEDNLNDSTEAGKAKR